MITTTRMWSKIQPQTATLLIAHPQNEKKGNCLVTQQPDIALNKVPWKFQTIPCRDEKGGVGDNGPCSQSPKSGREHCLSRGTVQGQGEQGGGNV